MNNYTKGPLTVVVSNEWPFDIYTKDRHGCTVFVDPMPATSPMQESAEDALNGEYLNGDLKIMARNANQVALANAKLRAAAPTMLEMLKQLKDCEILNGSCPFCLNVQGHSEACYYAKLLEDFS